MAVFYSVQSLEDSRRLAAGGTPWPTGLRRANLGPGLYAWDSPEAAQQYRLLLEKRGAADLRIVAYEIADAELVQLRKVDLTTLADADVDAWMQMYSHYGAALPHGFDYVVRATEQAREHYLAATVFARLRELK